MIAPRFVGLCGTDVQVLRGVHRCHASTLGHEGVGVVVEVGEDVTEWATGDAVVFNPVNPGNRDEILGFSFDGLFQEKFLIRDVDSRKWLIQPIPHNMMGPIGALIGPVATAIYSQELINSSSEGRAAVVVGDGPIALINSVVLRHSGFETVLMIHGRSQRHRWAIEHGYFDESDVIFGRGNVVARVVERLGGELADVAIICTPSESVEWALQDAVAYLKPDGLVDFISAAEPPVASLKGLDLNVNDVRHRNFSGCSASGGYVEQVELDDGKCIHVTGQSGISSSHLEASIELLSNRSSDFAALVTDVVDLGDAPSLISTAVGWSIGKAYGRRPMKAVIEFNRGSL